MSTAGFEEIPCCLREFPWVIGLVIRPACFEIGDEARGFPFREVFTGIYLPPGDHAEDPQLHLALIFLTLQKLAEQTVQTGQLPTDFSFPVFASLPFRGRLVLVYMWKTPG